MSFSYIRRFFRERRVYWLVVQELSSYSDRELHAKPRTPGPPDVPRIRSPPREAASNASRERRGPEPCPPYPRIFRPAGS
jgi:hypothetical protein